LSQSPTYGTHAPTLTAKGDEELAEAILDCPWLRSADLRKRRAGETAGKDENGWEYYRAGDCREYCVCVGF